jgi:hypothetical protein
VCVCVCFFVCFPSAAPPHARSLCPRRTRCLRTRKWTATLATATAFGLPCTSGASSGSCRSRTWPQASATCAGGCLPPPPLLPLPPPPPLLCVDVGRVLRALRVLLLRLFVCRAEGTTTTNSSTACPGLRFTKKWAPKCDLHASPSPHAHSRPFSLAHRTSPHTQTRARAHSPF